MTFTIKEAYDRIELCYENIYSATSTRDRKRNYEQILLVMEQCPAVKDYWSIRQYNNFYIHRVVKIKNYVEPKKAFELIADLCGEPFDERDCEACAYVMFLEDLNMIKVGKTKNLKTRKHNLEKQYGPIKILHTFGFCSDEKAFDMEIRLHEYYKKFYKNCEFVKQDRFKDATLTEKDILILERVAEEIRLKRWF